MKNTLTNQQISNYRRDGFIVIEDFFDHNELEDWRSKVEKAVELRNDNPMPKGDIKYFSWIHNIIWIKTFFN
jgi:hypothetical protein